MPDFRVSPISIVNQIIYNIDDIDHVFPAQDMEDALPEVIEVALAQLRASATGWRPEDFGRARAGLRGVPRLATSKTAELLAMGDRIGRIEQGFEADLVVLDADPLADIGNTAQVHGVLNNGRLFLAADLRKR